MGDGKNSFLTVALCLVVIFEFVEAQETCFSGGDLAGAIFGTFFATLLLVACGFLFYRYYWINKKEKRLVLTNDPENVKDEFAFDNPGFKATEGAATKPTGWLKLNTSVEKPITTHDGKTFLDDTFPENNRGSTVVPLWSKDFTGLGFEVSGSMRDGIYVSRVLRGGPAYESEKIHTGDRINSVRISFRNMVYEDALSILSFASPYELQLEVQSPTHSLSNMKDVQTRLTAILAGNANAQRSPGSTMQITNEKMKRIPGYDSLDKNWKSGKEEIKHPIIGIKRPRSNSYGDMSTLDKSLRHSYLPQPPGSPNTTYESTNSTKNTSLKKILTDKIIPSTLEKNKSHFHHGSKDQRNSHLSTLDRENEKNARNKMGGEMNFKMDINKHKDEVISKPERSKLRMNDSNIMSSSPPDVIIIKDGGDMYSVKNEKMETQKREPDVGKKGMKFGIRVLPPNIPDDITIHMNSRNSKQEMKPANENGNIVAEIRSIDEVDRKINTSFELNKELSVEVKEKVKPVPVVAKRREKPVAPIPNARIQSQLNISQPHLELNGQVKIPETLDSNILLNRNDDLNSSGIKRDAQGIPQEIPQHMLEAAICARNNRKSTPDTIFKESVNLHVDLKKIETPSKTDTAKNTKKSKGKAPSPPENASKVDEADSSNDKSIFSDDMKNASFFSKDMNFTDNFTEEVIEKINKIKDTNKSDDMILSNSQMNTSTPKIDKTRQDKAKPQDDESLMYEIKPMKTKEMSDSMNNFFDDTKSNASSNFDVNSVTSFSQDSSTQNSDKNPSATIELNSSDITIHSSPVNEIEIQEDNERKASSLGDLSKLDTIDKNTANKKKSIQGTLERAQSLDISSEETQTMNIEKSSKKRKSNSVFDGSYYDEMNDTPIQSSESVNQILTHSKEPRLSLDIGNISSMDGLNTFQKNRLKKSSEWGNLEDIISRRENAGSSHSGSSDIANSAENLNESIINNRDILTKVLEEENTKLNQEINKLKLLSNFESNDYNNEITIAKKIETNPSSVKESPNRKPDVPIRSKIPTETNGNSKFEISSYISDPSINKYKDTPIINSGQLSPKLEEKLTMIYDTNIPDDIKVSRHTLVSSLERPKSDLMKKLLAQNPVLTSNIDQPTSIESENTFSKSVNLTNPDVCNDRNMDTRINSTTLTLLNQPDIVNLRIKPNTSDDQNKNDCDFVSSINVGNITNDESKINFHVEGAYSPEKISSRNFFASSDNVVTISTDGSQPSSIITIEGESPVQIDNFRNSIEINSDTKNDIDSTNGHIEEEDAKKAENSESIVHTSSKTYFSEMANTSPFVITTETTKYETVTVNMSEIDPEIKENDAAKKSSGVDLADIEASIIVENRKQIIETISFSEHSTEHHQKNIKISEVNLMKDNSDIDDRLVVTNTQFKFNNVDDINDSIIPETTNDIDSETVPKDFVTEIEVSTSPKRISSDTDSKFVDDFLSIERDFSSNEKDDSDKYQHRRSVSPVMMRNGNGSNDSMKDDLENDDQKMKRHSDFDLPRNTHIKFRTATYEPPNPIPNRLSLTSEKRLSQIEILKSNFEKASLENMGKPSISTKPSNIPIKLPEKSPPKTPNVVSPSKIPILNNQKSVSQENLLDKSNLQKSPNNKLSTSSGNISVTSIKSSSRNPSGK